MTDPIQDPLYEQAVRTVTSTRSASIATLQRHLLIGYNRAARLIEQMEQDGLVTRMDACGRRSVLASS